MLTWIKRTWLCFTLLISTSCAAQTVLVRAVNSNSGKPMSGRQITIALLYEKGDTLPAQYDAQLTLTTDAEGQVEFTLPNPAPGHLSAHITLPQTWTCQCMVLAKTQEIVDQGITAVNGSNGGAKSTLPFPKASPKEILFLAHPASFWERLLYPLEKD